jgi:hypothetical protein
VIYFCDNDIIYKLARWSLWDEALMALNASAEQVRVLPSAIYKARQDLADSGKPPSNRRKRQLVDKATCNAAIALLTNLKVVQDKPPDAVRSLLAIENIHQGEAELLAHVWNTQDLFLTNDKSCLKALAAAVTAAQLAPLAGRVVCLEVVFALLVKCCGCGYVARKVNMLSDIDKAIESSFRNSDNPDNVRAGLQSYYDDLARQTGTLLAPMP